MRITRKEIIRVIRTERLKGGQWIQEDLTNENDELYHSGCKVCAVGAVLRSKGVDNSDIDFRARTLMDSAFGCSESGDVEYALERKAYLNALSIKFETLAARLGAGKRTREQLIKFVKANFPKQFNVNI